MKNVIFQSVLGALVDHCTCLAKTLAGDPERGASRPVGEARGGARAGSGSTTGDITGSIEPLGPTYAIGRSLVEAIREWDDVIHSDLSIDQRLAEWTSRKRDDAYYPNISGITPPKKDGFSGRGETECSSAVQKSSRTLMTMG